MDQPRKVAKPARGQLLSVVSTYICTGTVLLFVLVYIPGTIIFFIWTCTLFVHDSLLYNMHIYIWYVM